MLLTLVRIRFCAPKAGPTTDLETAPKMFPTVLKVVKTVFKDPTVVMISQVNYPQITVIFYLISVFSQLSVLYQIRLADSLNILTNVLKNFSKILKIRVVCFKRNEVNSICICFILKDKRSQILKRKFSKDMFFHLLNETSYLKNMAWHLCTLNINMLKYFALTYINMKLTYINKFTLIFGREFVKECILNFDE